LHEFTLHLSAALLADDSPYKIKIDESLAKGTLGKYCRCRLSPAIQIVAAELSQNLGLQILQNVEKTLEDDEAARENARKAAEEAERAKARAAAQETAKTTAEEVVTEVNKKVAMIEIWIAKNTIPKGSIAIAGGFELTHETTDDKFFQLPDLPFDVALYDHSSKKVFVTDNGMICLDQGTDEQAQARREGQLLPSRDGIPPYSLFPFWTDLVILKGKPHGIFYKIVGETGARSLTVEWYITRYKQETQYFHFSVLLQEARPNVVTFKYYDAVDKGAKCTIGVQGPRDFMMFSHNKEKVFPGLQIVFDTGANTMKESKF
jgi:hypothetical protein